MTSSLPPVNGPGLAAAPLPADPNAAANTYTDISGLAALKRDPDSEQSIKAVAQQVEAMFLQMMLKSMRDAKIDSGTDDNEMSMYQDMFDKQVALNMSQHTDLGIAALLKRQTGNKGPAVAAHGAAGAVISALSPAVMPAAPTPAEFVSQVMPAIERAASELGVDAHGLLAQAALETGWGQRMPRMPDGSPSHNLFGIKAGEEWGGARATADTVEFANGVATPRRSAFRAYGSVDESIDDFAKLLKHSPRYRDVIQAGGDTQAYVASIGKSGYATDPEYANKLNRILGSGAMQAALVSRSVKL